MKKQQGMTLPSMLVMGVIVLLLIKAGMALVPMYWDDRLLGVVLTKLEQTPDERQRQSPQALHKVIAQRLESNNLPISVENLKVLDNKKGGYELDWDYERRANWIANIDLVVRFHQQKDITK